jgi:hypothetical protein
VSHLEESEDAPDESTSGNGTLRPSTLTRNVAPAHTDTSGSDLEDIDLSISQMLAEEPTVWEFSELRLRAETALARAETAIERGHAKRMLAKISRFEEIKRRFEGVADVQAATDRDNDAPLDVADVEPMIGRRDELSRFDGVGRLTTVVSQRIGAPKFALLDERGAVTSFITPAPGVSLRQHVGRHVGVTGLRGRSPELSAPHLTARRVTLLDDRTAK